MYDELLGSVTAADVEFVFTNLRNASAQRYIPSLERALRSRGQLGRRQSLGSPGTGPGIDQAKTGRGGGAGSLWRGAEWLHRLMIRPGAFEVHPRCERVIASLERWDGTRDSEWKDACDALRYAVWPYAIRDPEIRVATDWRVW